jgi:hypothetical protein
MILLPRLIRWNDSADAGFGADSVALCTVRADASDEIPATALLVLNSVQVPCASCSKSVAKVAHNLEAPRVSIYKWKSARAT